MMQIIFDFFKKYRLAIYSGLLIGFSYIPFPPWAVLFCYVPLFLSILNNNWGYRESFIAAWLTQFVLTLIGFHWVAYTTHEYGHFPWIISILALLLFCIFFHLYIPLTILFCVWLRKILRLNHPSFIFTMALTLALAERIWPSIFPWNMGYALYWGNLPIYQWADTIGFLGLSTVLFVLNAMITLSLQTQHKQKWLPAIIAAILFIVLNVSGHFHKKHWDTADAELNFLAIQANIGNTEKIEAEKGRGFQSAIIQKFLDLSEKNLSLFPDADILIWPETAVPEFMDLNLHERALPKMLESGLSQMKRPVLTGAYSKDLTINHADRSVFNSLFLLDENAKELSPPYRKTHLLAFGEYLPLSETFPILLKWLPFIANFGRGPGPSILSWKKSADNTVKFGGQICYEGLYPEFSRSLSSQETQILINVTNDSWFGTTSEPNQHMIMTFARAIETRRPLMRATNTGYTSAVLANGQILEKSPLKQEWAGLYKIKYQRNPKQSFYVLYGHWDWVYWLTLLLIILIKGRKNARFTKS